MARTGSLVIRCLRVGLPAAAAALPLLSMPAVAESGGGYVPLAPIRILDTRLTSTPIGAGQSRDLVVTPDGVSAAAMTAVVLNVTATAPTASGYLTVWPAGDTQPTASALNFSPNQTVANLVEVGTGGGGKVSIFNHSGSVDVVVDLEGYVTAGAGGLYNPFSPRRVLDTRDGRTLGPQGVLRLKLADREGVPAAGASAVALNLTAVEPTTPGFLTAWPAGTPRPNASSLNFAAGQTVANRAVVKLGLDGAIDIFNSMGISDVVIDVSGWYTEPGAGNGSTFTPVTPTRIMDTRTNHATLGPRGAIGLQVAGRGVIPAMDKPGAPSAVVANVTVTDTSGSGYLTVWPDRSAQPLASDINWSAGTTVPNLVLVQVGASGRIQLYNSSSCANVIVDVVGWFTGSAPAPATVAPAVTVACPPPPPPPAAAAHVAELNQFRTAAGLEPLKWSNCLADVAASQAALMALSGNVNPPSGADADLACGLGPQAFENTAACGCGMPDDFITWAFTTFPSFRSSALGPYAFVGMAWAIAADGWGYIAVEFS